MQATYLFDEIAIMLRHWYEIGPRDEEHGCRVEIRAVVRPAHMGSESAAQPITIDMPLWRADIFDLIGDVPGNLARAHYHPAFNGREPVGRTWDAALKSDWQGWLAGRLTDLSATLAAVDPQPNLAGADRLLPVLPDLLSQAEQMLGKHCDGRDGCLAMTTDTRQAVTLMLDQFRQPGAPDPRLAAT